MVSQIVIIGGTPRSGTTALASFLNAHPDIFIGVERYLYRFCDGGPLVTTKDFSVEAFGAIEPRDTFYTDVSEIEGWLDEEGRVVGPQRLENARVCGEKSPISIFYFTRIKEQIPDATFICVVRDVLSVGRSWQARADNADDALWSRTDGFKEGVDFWFRSMKSLRFQRKQGTTIHVVMINELFGAQDEELDRLMRIIKVERGPEWDRYITQEREARASSMRTPRPVTDAERQTILSYEEMPALLDELFPNKPRAALLGL